MITISRAEYEALQAELAEQKQQLESKRAELESKRAELKSKSAELAATRGAAKPVAAGTAAAEEEKDFRHIL